VPDCAVQQRSFTTYWSFIMADAIADQVLPNGQTETKSSPTPKPAKGRGKHGYFTAGNPGGPGNPFAGKIAVFRAALLQTITAEDIKALVVTLIESGKNGDTAAARLVLAYALGKPPSSPDDLQAWLPQQATAGQCAEPEDVGSAAPVPPATPPATPVLPLSQPLAASRPPAATTPAARRFAPRLTDGLRAQPKLTKVQRKRAKAERKKARRLAAVIARAKAAEDGQQTGQSVDAPA
jgi:hypothetical protein